MASCVAKSTPAGNGLSLQGQTKPIDAPVELQQTGENHGKKCEAKYYFGPGRIGQDDGYSPYCYKLQLRLMTAAREGNISDIRATLKLGANSNLPVDDSFPPLHTAALRGQIDAVRLLLDNGAQVNNVADFENTPLNVAAYYGHMDIVRLLLVRGADICYGGKGETAGDLAQKRGEKEIAELLKGLEKASCPQEP